MHALLVFCIEVMHASYDAMSIVQPIFTHYMRLCITERTYLIETNETNEYLDIFINYCANSKSAVLGVLF